jgi:bacteriocin-like protein
MAVTAARAGACHIGLISQTRRKAYMSKHQTNAINTGATSKQVREFTDRELTEDELAHVSGGIIAILIGLLSSSAPPPTVQSK